MPFVAKRAIILAAGRGLRLSPLSDKVPKPLLVFGDRPIIENIIEKITGIGIKAITVVVGYKAEQFAYLTQKYPFLRLHHNLRWDEGNNILSVHSVIEQCENALVVNGDAIIFGDVLKKTYGQTTMYADRSRGYSKEWELQLDKKGHVTKINVSGGTDILQHREITFISARDFGSFKSAVRSRVDNGSRLDDYFEFCLLPWAKVAVYEVPHGSIFDLDGYQEWMEHPLTAKSV